MGMIDKTEIYETYKSKVYGYLLSKVGNVQDAEDLCGDVFVKIYAHLDTFDDSKSSLSTWIYNITRNTLYDHFRTSYTASEIDEEYAQVGDFVDDICNDETIQSLADALEKLGERDRDIILLHYYRGDTLKTIAERMDISYSYAKVLHNNALENLKKLFVY